MSLDIRPDHLRIVRNILRNYVPNHRIWIFGSRATDSAKSFSDLDICLQGQTAISLSTLGNLRADFSASNLPYMVDIVDWYSIGDHFRQIIEKHKVELLLYP